MSDAVDSLHGELLLVTRNFPPQLGGMERYSADLYQSLAELMPVVLISNRIGKRGIPFLILRVIWHALRHRRHYWRIHFTDAAMAPLACLVRAITGTPVTITTHALDVIFPNALYQRVIPACLRRLDGVISVSNFTRDACIDRGVDASRCRVIPNGIRIIPDEGSETLASAKPWLPAHAVGKRQLVSIGRLVRRKGVAWFVSEVMPRLTDEWVYLIAGEGEERAAIEHAISEKGLEGRVFLLGRVDEKVKRALLESAEYFVMPNITIPGDAEGFGISIIESTLTGLPVLATGIEGIRDAVIDGVTGRSLPERDVDAWVRAITESQFDRDAVSRETLEQFDWARLAESYLDFYRDLLSRR